MGLTTIGDMAQHMMLRRQTTSVKSDLDRLANELGSGMKSDVARYVQGDFSMLAGVERQLTVLDGYSTAAVDARIFTETAQAVLGQVHTLSGDLGADLLSATQSGLAATVDSVANSAANDFDAIVNALNGRASNRTLFGGTSTGGAALISPNDMMTQLSAAVAGALTISDIVAAVDDYFMTPGGGFETNAYLGNQNDLAPFRLGDTETAHFNIRADDTEMREVMRDTALGALVNDAGLNLDAIEKKQLMQIAGERLLTGQDSLIRVQADLGFNQERIETAETNISAQRSSLQMTQNEFLTVDSADVAGKLQAVQVQLEMVYTITARLSQLSLANYLR